jgi:HlyD family secretion protein
MDSAGTSTFKARVMLATQELSSVGRPLAIAAGMQVQAEIRQGERTVMEYLLSPVQKVAAQSGVER